MESNIQADPILRLPRPHPAHRRRPPAVVRSFTRLRHRRIPFSSWCSICFCSDVSVTSSSDRNRKASSPS